MLNFLIFYALSFSPTFSVTFASLVQLFAVRYYVIVPDTDVIMPRIVTKSLFILAYIIIVLFVWGIGYYVLGNDQDALKLRMSSVCDILNHQIWHYLRYFFITIICLPRTCC